jgi:hypothetical protein
MNKLSIHQDSNSMNPRTDWDTIVRNERLLEELYKAIEILSLVE